MHMNSRAATLIRVVGLGLISWTVLGAQHGPGTSGRGLVVSVSLAITAAAWLAWTRHALGGLDYLRERGLNLELWAMAIAGGVLTAASPSSAASAFVFVAVVAAGLRTEARRAFPVALAGAFALAVGVLIYDESALGTLAYSLGFAAAMFAASNSRGSVLRADQAELLLAQSQRSHEEQLRAARFEESARIAREIHDVLAHTLAGLTIQLEATATLVEQGTAREVVLARIRRAHELAREGLLETRRAVGALRGEPVAGLVSVTAGLEALATAHRCSSDAPLELEIAGESERLAGAASEAVLRVAQEALTNARKHAPAAEVLVRLEAGSGPSDPVLLIVEDRWLPGAQPLTPSPLADSGGGYGIRGMRERAAELGGAVVAGATDAGWRVELRLPGAAVSELRDRGAEAFSGPFNQ